MSQSAVSGALADLERQFDVRLFERVGKRLQLSELGRSLRPRAEALCQQALELESGFTGRADAGQLRVGATLSIGNSREIILGEIVYAHFRGDTVDERLHVDPAALDAVGRMGGHGYATTRDYFDLPTMPLATWRNDPDAANRRS